MIRMPRITDVASRASLICLVSVLSISCGPQYDPPEQDTSTIALPIPDGHCALSRSNAVEEDLFIAYHNIYRGRGWRRSMFAECEELAAFRDEGIRPNHIGSYTIARNRTALPSWYVGQPAALSRAQAIELLAREYQHTDPTLPTAPRITSTEEFIRWRARMEFGLQRLSYLGVLRSDESAVYIGTLEHVVQGDYTLATVIAVTSIGGNLVNLDLSAPHAGEDTIETLMEIQRSNVRSLIAANP